MWVVACLYVSGAVIHWWPVQGGNPASHPMSALQKRWAVVDDGWRDSFHDVLGISNLIFTPGTTAQAEM